jgi:hypothetical protein
MACRGVHHLYVVELVDFGVKFGITTNPPKRMAQHTAAALNYGFVVGAVWVSEPSSDSRVFEAELRRQNGGKEYMPGSTHEDVVARIVRMSGLTTWYAGEASGVPAMRSGEAVTWRQRRVHGGQACATTGYAYLRASAASANPMTVAMMRYVAGQDLGLPLVKVLP